MTLWAPQMPLARYSYELFNFHVTFTYMHTFSPFLPPCGQGERYLTWWMGRIEQALDAEGYAIGDKLSLADLYIYNSFQETLREEEAVSESLPRWRREPFGDLAAVTKKLMQV